jgi:hypothetical protein
VVDPQDDAEEQKHISPLPRFLFIIFERMSWSGQRLSTDPARQEDRYNAFSLNCGPNEEYRLAATISEANIPEENNYVTFINLDGSWQRFDSDGIRRVPYIEQRADRWNGPGG